MPKILDDVYAYIHPKGLNCNIYVFKDGSEFDLIDSGIHAGGVSRWLWSEMRKDGIEPRHVRNIFHCHVHPDHIHADTLFQSRATRNKGKVCVFYPYNDRHRLSSKFHLVQSNFYELTSHFPNYPVSKFTGTKIFAGFLLGDLLGYKIPSNLKPLVHNQKVKVGSRSAKVIFTGGHTQGHSFLHIDDEDHILVNSDNGCINEFTSNWRKSIESIKLEMEIAPDNLLGGHDPLKLGKEQGLKDNASQFRRFDNLMKPFLLRARIGKKINISDCAYRRVGFLHKIKLVNFWAHMSIYCTFKYFEEKNLGTLSTDGQGVMSFTCTNDKDKFHFFQILRDYLKSEESSLCEATLEYFKN